MKFRPSAHLLFIALTGSVSIEETRGQSLPLLVELPKSHLPLRSGSTNMSVAADFDGDGDLDLAMARDDWYEDALYLNLGDAVFRDVSSRLPRSDEESRAVAAGDLDRDGDVDLLIATRLRFTPSRLIFCENDGAGMFRDASAQRLPPFPAGSSVEAMLLGDFDRDGDLDIVLGKRNESGIGGARNALYRNDGTGRFTDLSSTHLLSGPGETWSLAMGDVDGDGDLDLVEGHYGPGLGRDRLLLNDGGGVFRDASPGRLPTYDDDTLGLALADLDGDLDLDLVIANTRWVGTTRDPRDRVLFNDGTGTFVEGPPLPPSPGSSLSNDVEAMDLDEDGDLDLVFAAEWETVAYVNDGGGRFSEATGLFFAEPWGRARSLTTADLDGNGHADLLFGNAANGSDHLELNLGRGRFRDAGEASMPRSGKPMRRLEIGDVDGDGDEDVVVGDDAGVPTLMLNDGQARFLPAHPALALTQENAGDAILLRDLDGDGDLDLAVGGYKGTGGPVRFLRNDGYGSLIEDPIAMPPFIDRAYHLSSGDFDGDSDVDLFVNALGLNRLYLNDGTGRFHDGGSSRLPPPRSSTQYAQAVEVGDIDRDGDFDLVIDLSIFANDGLGYFTDQTQQRMPNVYLSVERRGIELVDVDADGYLDLVIAVWGDSDLLYRNRGNGSFVDESHRLPRSSNWSWDVVAVDIDADADQDLLITSTSNTRGVRGQGNQILLNDGRGFFSDASSEILSPTHFRAAFGGAFADFDLDGDLDLLLAHYESSNVVLFNTSRQIHTPFLLRAGRVFDLHVYGRGTQQWMVPFLASNTLSPKLSCPPFGLLSLDPALLSFLPVIEIAAGVRRTTLSTVVAPDLPLGLQLSIQALYIDSPLPSEWRLSNATVDRLTL